MNAPFDLTDDSVVVTIGTGAGGGVLANELAKKSVRVVARGGRVLPAGRLPQRRMRGLRPARKDRSAYHQRRVARGERLFGPPAWIVKAVGGTTTHRAGASIRFQPHEWKAKRTYGDVQGANAEKTLSVTPTTAIPGSPAATTTGSSRPARRRSDTRRSIPAGWRSTRPGTTIGWCASRPGSASKAASGARSDPSPAPTFPRARRPAILSFARRRMSCGSSTVATVASFTSMPRASSKSRWPEPSASPATRSRARGFCSTPRVRCVPTVWPILPARRAATTCVT